MRIDINVLLVIIVVIEKVQIYRLKATPGKAGQHDQCGQSPMAHVEFGKDLQRIARDNCERNNEIQGQPGSLVGHERIRSEKPESPQSCEECKRVLRLQDGNDR